jgi:hypothetical protein
VIGARRRADDDRRVAHLMTILSVSVLFYATVTRGGLAFARLLARVTRR